ncbi:MAG: hypothetical protein HXX12_14800 [Geothrix sp.]|uniref:hypothetical protein n=1 Tax=Geothrix sp. TaxID=1962974 RepID=UPI0017A281D3|nr:hypothetical protein [Geothrix sp.]NWJ42230.1 hypothetical protein [Geothrix sp.]WIL19803.1 MAG: hypothetical protein QOZ81_002336 [Geothrix sp.]
MNPSNDTSAIQIVSLFLSVLSLIFSSYVVFRYRRRHLRQKITEMSLEFALDKIRTAHTAWLNMANSMQYFGYLCILAEDKRNGNGPGWSVAEETGTEPFNVYHEGKVAMLDLLYSFSDDSDPLLLQIFKKEEIIDICSRIKQYQPFTLLAMTAIHREDRYMTMLNDLLAVNSTIKKAIARQ